MASFFVQELILERHFMLIDSPIPFELVANPTNFIRNVDYSVADAEKVTGRDICSRPAGAWRVDCFKLLSENYHKNNPVFTMLIKYDMDLLHEGESVDIRYSDIDIGEGVAGVNGQLVNISPSDFIPIIDKISDSTAEIVDSLASVLNSQESSNTLLSAVRDAVLEVNTGSINNKIEQIRTVLKSSISAPSPFYDIKHSQDLNFQTLERYLSNFPRRVYKNTYLGSSSLTSLTSGIYKGCGYIRLETSSSVFTASGEFVFVIYSDSTVPVIYAKNGHISNLASCHEVYEPVIYFSSNSVDYSDSSGIKRTSFDDSKFWGIVYKDE